MENKPHDSERNFFEEMDLALLESSAPVAELLSEGLKLAMDDSLDEALELFEKATAGMPASFHAWLCRGYTELSLMMNDEAEASFLRARELNPRDICVRYWLAHTHFLKDMVEEAVGEFQEIIAESPNFTDAYYDCGVCFQIMGRYDDAMDVFLRRVAISPDFDTFVMLAMTCEFQQNLEKAAEFYAKALEMEPDNIMVIESHGATCLELGRLEDAMSDFQYALEIDPGSPDALYGRGHTFFQMEKIAEAKNDLHKVVELDPENALAWSMLGQIMLYDGDYPQAIAFLNKALEVDADILIYAFRGQAKMGMEDYDAAVLDFTLALEFEPEEPDYYYYRGMSYFTLDRYQEAVNDFNEAAKLDPDWDDYRVRGIAYSQLLMFEEAISDLTRAIRLTPDDLNLYLHRAEAYCALEKSAEATRDIREAITLAEKQNDEALAARCRKFLKEIERMEE